MIAVVEHRMELELAGHSHQHHSSAEAAVHMEHREEDCTHLAEEVGLGSRHKIVVGVDRIVEVAHHIVEMGEHRTVEAEEHHIAVEAHHTAEVGEHPTDLDPEEAGLDIDYCCCCCSTLLVSLWVT